MEAAGKIWEILHGSIANLITGATLKPPEDTTMAIETRWSLVILSHDLAHSHLVGFNPLCIPTVWLRPGFPVHG